MKTETKRAPLSKLKRNPDWRFWIRHPVTLRLTTLMTFSPAAFTDGTVMSQLAVRCWKFFFCCCCCLAVDQIVIDFYLLSFPRQIFPVGTNWLDDILTHTQVHAHTRAHTNKGRKVCFYCALLAPSCSFLEVFIRQLRWTFPPLPAHPSVPPLSPSLALFPCSLLPV